MPDEVDLAQPRPGSPHRSLGQLLTDDRPTGLVDTVGQLWAVQLDPTSAVAPSADLVAWSGLGTGYRPAHLVAALETERTLFEHRWFVRAMADLDAGQRAFRRYLLDELEDDGPMRTRDLDDRRVEPWASTTATVRRGPPGLPG